MTEPGATGYLHPDYAVSFSDIGTPLALPGSGSWLIERPISVSAQAERAGVADEAETTGTAETPAAARSAGETDAMGPYPLFCCRDWLALPDDLAALRVRRQHGEGPIAVSLVADPFGDHDAALLARCFPDVRFAYKTHHVIDVAAPDLERTIAPHHRRNARLAERALAVERCADPVAHLDQWRALYVVLAQRHHISGPAAFSREAFRRQLAVPGLVAFRAETTEGGAETAGMLLWYVQGDVAYYHLGAYSERGYALRASFALFWHAIAHFRALGSAGPRWLSLGAGAGLVGLDGDDENGLDRFKRGWANAQRTAYFCGAVLDRTRYDALVRASGTGGARFFPAYRAPVTSLATVPSVSPASTSA